MVIKYWPSVKGQLRVSIRVLCSFASLFFFSYCFYESKHVNQKWIIFIDPTPNWYFIDTKKDLNTLSCSTVMWRGVHESPFLLDTAIIIECKNMVLTTSVTLLNSHFGYILTYPEESSFRSLLRPKHKRLNKSSHLHGC